jgi:20S proteasome alpha/beta subunit
MLVLTNGRRFPVLETRSRTQSLNNRNNSLLWRLPVTMVLSFSLSFSLWLVLLLLVGIYPSLAEAAVSGSTTTASSVTSQKQPPQGSFPLQATTSDPFVEASPLVVGVVCRDGVLLLALHSIFSETNDESSLLLVRQECKPPPPPPDNNNNNDNGGSEEETKTQQQTEQPSPPPSLDIDMDLPESYRGPFRIHPLDASGTAAMVCAGWRTDCGVLADHLRSIDRSETFVFGSRRPLHSNSHSLTANTNNNTKNMGGVLADKASLFLARRSVSERTRSLACAGLLASASSSSSSTSASAGGFLWVVDATGAYAVRAHALGRGSEKANEILRARDWTKLESSAVQTELLRLLLLRPKSNSDANSDDGSDDIDNDNQIIELPKGSRFEMAIVESSPTDRNTQRKTMKRLFASI